MEDQNNDNTGRNLMSGVVSLGTGVNGNNFIYLPAAATQPSSNSIFYMPATTPALTTNTSTSTNTVVSNSEMTGAKHGMQFLDNGNAAQSVSIAAPSGPTSAAQTSNSLDLVPATTGQWFFRQVDGSGTVLSNNPMLAPNYARFYEYNPQTAQATQALLAQQLSSLIAKSLPNTNGKSMTSKSFAKSIPDLFWEKMIHNSSAPVEKNIIFALALTLYGCPASLASVSSAKDLDKQTKLSEAILKNHALHSRTFDKETTAVLFRSCRKPGLEKGGTNLFGGTSSEVRYGGYRKRKASLTCTSQNKRP